MNTNDDQNTPAQASSTPAHGSAPSPLDGAELGGLPVRLFSEAGDAVKFWNWTMMHEPATGGVIQDEVVTNPTPATVAMNLIGVPSRIKYDREQMYANPPEPGGWDKEDCAKVAAFLRGLADAISPLPNDEVSHER